MARGEIAPLRPDAYYCRDWYARGQEAVIRREITRISTCIRISASGSPTVFY